MRLPRTKEWREARGLSQRELSAEAGVGESTVPRIERGESVTPPTARKIADALGVSVSDLLESPPVPLASAPSASPSPEAAEAGLADDLGAKVVEIQSRYEDRAKGLRALCEHWEARLDSLDEGEALETLDEMSRVGACVTPFFLEAAVDETVEIGAALLVGYPKKPSNADADAAADAAQKSSIMRPALERWERLGKEVARRGVGNFGDLGGVDEIARQRAKKLRRAG